MFEFSFIHSFPITSNLANPIKSVLSFLSKSSINPLFQLPHRSCHCISSKQLDHPIGIISSLLSLFQSSRIVPVWDETDPHSTQSFLLLLFSPPSQYKVKTPSKDTRETRIIATGPFLPPQPHLLTQQLSYSTFTNTELKGQCLDSSSPQLLFLLPSDIFPLPPFHWAHSLSTVYGAWSTKSLVSLEVRMDIVAPLHPLSILQPSMPWSLVGDDFSPYCVCAGKAVSILKSSSCSRATWHAAWMRAEFVVCAWS